MGSKRSVSHPDEGSLAISGKAAPKRLRTTDVDVLGHGELLHLDDPTLLMVIKNLGPKDRLSLGQVCLRLERLCQDHSFWFDVDADHPMTNEEIEKILPLLHHRTSRIALKGFLHSESAANSQQQTITPSLLMAFQSKCPQLKEVKLTECFVDGSKITTDKFSKTLERLSLANCQFVNLPRGGAFFCGLLDMPWLCQLDLSGCEWVAKPDLVVIATTIITSRLEEVSLRGCIGIRKFFIAIIACKRDKALKKLDLRDTDIGDEEVSLLGRQSELTHLKIGKSRAEDNRPIMRGTDKEITDHGIFSLCRSIREEGSSKLQYLTLTNMPKVTDQVMSCLATSMPLKRLDVRGTRISALGALNLPDCDVVMDTATALPLARS